MTTNLSFSHEVPARDYEWQGPLPDMSKVLCVICSKADCPTPISARQEAHVISWEAASV